jgi:hypothetical protein
MSLIFDTKLVVITNYGKTEFFKVNRGVKQGDVISPTLFMIWINPLMEYIEKEEKGYEMNGEKVKIPILVFADNIALFTKNNEDMQKIFGITSDFCTHSGMDISPIKSAYTSKNTKKNIPPIYKNKSIAKIRNNESYKYLGIEINIDLNWEDQMNILEYSLNKHINFLRHRKITTR